MVLLLLGEVLRRRPHELGRRAKQVLRGGGQALQHLRRCRRLAATVTLLRGRGRVAAKPCRFFTRRVCQHTGTGRRGSRSG